MRIGDLHRKALKKLLINGVEKSLFLGEVIDSCSGALDCNVKRVKAFEKLIAIKSVRHQRSDNGLDFTGNDIAVDKVRIAEHGSENPLGQEVLD